MNKTLNNELVDSLKDNLRKRMDSSIYGTFIVYWLIFHWNFVYTMFFISEDKIWNSMGLFKNDYLVKTFFNYHTVFFYIYWILPFALTYLTIWVFPKLIVIPAFKRESEDETEKKIFKINQEKKISSAQISLETEKTKEIKAVAKKVEEEKKIEKVDPKISWDRDYEEFKQSGYSPAFSGFLNQFYSGQKYLYEFSPQNISYFDALQLLELDGNEITSITAKGKHFALKLKQSSNTF
jgi:hypothetical protein